MVCGTLREVRRSWLRIIKVVKLRQASLLHDDNEEITHKLCLEIMMMVLKWYFLFKILNFLISNFIRIKN